MCYSTIKMFYKNMLPSHSPDELCIYVLKKLVLKQFIGFVLKSPPATSQYIDTHLVFITIFCKHVSPKTTIKNFFLSCSTGTIIHFDSKSFKDLLIFIFEIITVASCALLSAKTANLNMIVGHHHKPSSETLLL